jgi:hypothetical protein
MNCFLGMAGWSPTHIWTFRPSGFPQPNVINPPKQSDTEVYLYKTSEEKGKGLSQFSAENNT